MAYRNKKYLGPILLHSDNGNQYTSENYINLCNDLQIIRSYSKPGTPHHNGKHESFHSRLKDETIRTCHIENINQCLKIAWAWLDFYNNDRIRINKKW